MHKFPSTTVDSDMVTVHLSDWEAVTSLFVKLDKEEKGGVVDHWPSPRVCQVNRIINGYHVESMVMGETEAMRLQLACYKAGTFIHPSAINVAVIYDRKENIQLKPKEFLNGNNYQ